MRPTSLGSGSNSQVALWRSAAAIPVCNADNSPVASRGSNKRLLHKCSIAAVDISAGSRSATNHNSVDTTPERDEERAQLLITRPQFSMVRLCNETRPVKDSSTCAHCRGHSPNPFSMWAS